MRSWLVRLSIAGCLVLARGRALAAECVEEPPEPSEASCSETHEPPIPTLGTQNPTAEVQSFGLAGALTNARFQEQSEKDGSILVSAGHFSYDTRTIFSGRSYGFGFIGGGSAGFEGGLGGELAAGLRVPFGKRHGPVARIAVEGFLMGNDSFYASMLEFPKGELGYQFLDRVLLLEGAVTAGPVLTGFFNVEGAPDRSLGGLFAVGGHVALGFRVAHLELAANRLDSGDFELGEFNELIGSLCGHPSVFALCADGRYLTGGANDPEPDARVAYVGIRVGVVTSSAPKRPTDGRGRRRGKPP